jgi:hypothetical protein
VKDTFHFSLVQCTSCALLWPLSVDRSFENTDPSRLHALNLPFVDVSRSLSLWLLLCCSAALRLLLNLVTSCYQYGLLPNTRTRHCAFPVVYVVTVPPASSSCSVVLHPQAGCDACIIPCDACIILYNMASNMACHVFMHRLGPPLCRPTCVMQSSVLFCTVARLACLQAAVEKLRGRCLHVASGLTG